MSNHSHERELEQLGYRVRLLRNISILLCIFTLMGLGAVVFLPEFTIEQKVWLVSVSGCLTVGILITLILARHDVTATLFLSNLSTLYTGIVVGIGIAIAHHALKN